MKVGVEDHGLLGREGGRCRRHRDGGGAEGDELAATRRLWVERGDGWGGAWVGRRDASEALRREQEAGAPGDDQHACVVVWMT